LAITLIVQRMIDQSTYQNYFANEETAKAFLRMRTHLTVVASISLSWAGVVTLLGNY